MTETDKLMDKIVELTNLEQTDMATKALKTSEETGELAQAVLSVVGAHGTAYKNKTYDDILEEAADVIICAMSVAISAGFGIQEIEDMMAHKCKKWESKINTSTAVSAIGPSCDWCGATTKQAKLNWGKYGWKCPRCLSVPKGQKC